MVNIILGKKIVLWVIFFAKTKNLPGQKSVSDNMTMSQILGPNNSNSNQVYLPDPHSSTGLPASRHWIPVLIHRAHLECTSCLEAWKHADVTAQRLLVFNSSVCSVIRNRLVRLCHLGRVDLTWKGHASPTGSTHL